MLKKCIVISITLLTLVCNINIADSKSSANSMFYNENIYVSGGTKSVSVVDINLNSKNIYLDTATAHEKVAGDEEFSSMVKRNKPLASINANFFNVNTNKAPVGVIAKHGRVIYVSGKAGTTVRFDKDNKVQFASQETVIDGKINSNAGSENTWGAPMTNFIPKAYDDYGIMYTRDMANSINIKTKGNFIVVENNKIKSIVKAPNKVNIPQNGYVIYYGWNFRWHGDEYVKQRFKVGQTLSYKYVSNIKNGDTFWNNVQCAICCGPRILEYGSYSNLNNQGFYDSMVISGIYRRSAIGVTKNNKLLMVTANNVSTAQMAQIMKKLGAYNAICMDGGASTALYYKGKIITKPNRKLNTVLMVYEKK